MTLGPDTVTARLARHAAEHPGKIFCTFVSGKTEKTITFAQLYDRSLAYAARYRAMGIGRGDLVLVVLQHSEHLFYSFLGAMLAGAVPSFMPFPSAKQRADLYWADHQALFERIAPALLVTYEKNLQTARENIADFALPALVADDAIFEQGTHFEPAPSVPDDLACLQHSSGTTNLKKGVMLTHRAILEQVDAYANAIAFSDADSIASWLPLYHDMGFIACFMLSVVLGTSLVALDPFEWVMRPHTLFDAVQRHRATFCWLPNFAFGHLVRATRADAVWDLSSVRAFVNCSEPCKPETFARFLERFKGCGVRAEALQVCYAMAENVFAVTQTVIGRPVRTLELDAIAFFENRVVPKSEPQQAAVALLSCGPPVKGVHLEIRTASGEPAAPGTIGEIHVRSPFLFAGYYKLPEKTREKLRDGWYATADMGFLDGGELFVTGRVDDMLIIAGRNYYAHEIEAVVNGVPCVLPGRNVAIAVEDRLTDAMVVAVLAECADGTEAEALAQHVRKEVLERLGLAVHAVLPLKKGELIKTTSGKISRVKNVELYHERIGR